MTGERLHSIDWLKGAMIICVVLHHSFFFPNFRGYLGVDVFFFISGYFLMSSFLRKPTSTVQYTWNRIKQLAPPYLICLFLASIFHLRHVYLSGEDISLTDQTGQLLLALQFAEGLGGDLTNVSILLGSWFLSVLIICSFLLYGMLQYSERLSTLILFPAIVLLGFNAFIGYSPTMNCFDRIGILGASLIRGLYEMAAGGLICHVYTRHKASFERKAIWINTLGFISLAIFIGLLFSHNDTDKYLIVTIPWLLIASVIDNSWMNHLLSRFNGSILSRIGRYTIYVYCVHGLTETIVYWINDSFFHHSLDGAMLLIVLLVAVAITSIALYFLCKFISRVYQSNYTRL